MKVLTCKGSKHILHSEKREISSSQLGQEHWAAWPSSEDTNAGWTSGRDLSGNNRKYLLITSVQSKVYDSVPLECEPCQHKIIWQS